MIEVIEKALSIVERRKFFKEDGSCTPLCNWGYAFDCRTGICICLSQCRREFIPITEAERKQNLLELEDNFFYFLKEIFGIDLIPSQKEMVLDILSEKEFAIKKGRSHGYICKRE